MSEPNFLTSVVEFLRTYQNSLRQLQDRCGDEGIVFAELLENGEAFEYAENLEAYLMHFWSLLHGYPRAELEKRIAAQLSQPERFTLSNVSETALCTIRNVTAIPVTLETIQKTNAVTILYETAFVLMELLTRYESSLNPNAFLDRLKIQESRDPSLELTRIARYLQNHVVMVVKGRPYRLTEVEAYLQSPEHPDPFVHASAEQAKHCRWYVHKRGATAVEGTRKGLDITFGLEGSHHGGFLIRGIAAQDEPGHYVDGPSLCVDEILRGLGLKKAAQLSKNFQNVFTRELSPDFFLQSVPTLEFGEWCAAPRVGLPLKRESWEARLEFVDRLYRFHICPDQTKADPKVLFLSLITQGWEGGHARVLMNMKEATCRKAIEAYAAGKGKNPLQFLEKKTLSEADRCELRGALAGVAMHEIVSEISIAVDEDVLPLIKAFDEAA